MKWRGGRRSTNVQDQRNSGGGGGGFRLPGGFGRGRNGGGGGGFRLPGGLGGGGNRSGGGGGGFRLPTNIGRRGGGLGGGGGGRRGGMGKIIMIVIAGILFLVFGGDLGSLLGGMGGQPQSGGGGSFTQQRAPSLQPQQSSSTNDELADFVSVVLASTEDTWHEIFQQAGQRYQEPTLVLFSHSVRSACGSASSATGPFYCPGDQKMYIDLSFYDDLKNRFGAPGDFAQAYVIAHEVGHHVQTLLGISAQVQQAKRGASQVEANRIQVMMELQADCLAGLWAHHADRKNAILEPGDIEEALGAAAAIGDDRLQRQAQGHVVPDTFTHGSSEQRQRWFRIGFDKGDFNACNTFEASRL